MIDTVGLRNVPACVEACLGPSLSARAQVPAQAPGVIVLALDGLALHVAAQALAHAELAALRSTFPSTSATAWLTSVTGLEPSEHGVLGTVYREPGTERLVNVISGEVTGSVGSGAARVSAEREPAVLPAPTIFDRARTLGAEPLAVGAELAAPRGPWVSALLRGATLRV